MTRVLLALTLVACNMDAELGRQKLALPSDAAEEDAGDPPPDVSTIRRLFYGGWASVLVEGNELVVFGGVDDEPGHRVDEASGLLRIQRDGAFTTLLPMTEGWYMTADTRHYYVSGPKSVVAIDRSSFAQTTLITGPHTIEYAIVDDTWVFFVERRARHDQYGTSYPDDRVVRIDKDGANRRDLIRGLDTALGLAQDDNFIYLAEDMGGRVHAIPKRGCRPLELATGNRPSHVHVVADWLYFTERGGTRTDGRIRRVPRPTSACAAYQPTVPETIASGLGGPSYLQADETHIYWAGYFSGMQRAPLEGGETEHLYDCFGELHPGGLLPMINQGCGPFAFLGGELFYSARTPIGQWQYAAAFAAAK